MSEKPRKLCRSVVVQSSCLHFGLNHLHSPVIEHIVQTFYWQIIKLTFSYFDEEVAVQQFCHHLSEHVLLHWLKRSGCHQCWRSTGSGTLWGLHLGRVGRMMCWWAHMAYPNICGGLMSSLRLQFITFSDADKLTWSSFAKTWVVILYGVWKFCERVPILHGVLYPCFSAWLRSSIFFPQKRTQWMEECTRV